MLLWDQDDRFAIARYGTFSLSSQLDAAANLNDYTLHIGEFFSVNGDRDAGDSLGAYDGKKFSHTDRRHVDDRCLDNFDEMPGWYEIGLVQEKPLSISYYTR